MSLRTRLSATPSDKGRGPDPGGPNPVVSNAFNGFLLAHAVAALSEARVLERLAYPGGYRLPGGRSGEVLRAALAILGDARLVDVSDGAYTLTELGERVVEQRGFFIWAIGGYDSFFSSLGPASRGHRVSPRRDEAQVARGSGLIDRALLREEVAEYISKLRVGCIADLGCGDGTRLCDLATRDPRLTGIGVDRSSQAVRLARAQIERCGLKGRLGALRGDCLKPIRHRLTGRVDCVTSFFLLHELLFATGGNLGRVLEAVFASFPNADTFVFADTTRTDGFLSDPSPPVFIRGFELVHALMGIPTWSEEEYEALFRASELELVDRRALSVPATFLFVLRRHRRTDLGCP